MKDFGDEPLTIKTTSIVFFALASFAGICWLVMSFFDPDTFLSPMARAALAATTAGCIAAFCLLLRSQFREMDRNPERPQKTSMSKETRIALGLVVIVIGIVGLLLTMQYGGRSLANLVVIGTGVRMMLSNPTV